MRGTSRNTFLFQSVLFCLLSVKLYVSSYFSVFFFCFFFIPLGSCCANNPEKFWLNSCGINSWWAVICLFFSMTLFLRQLNLENLLTGRAHDHESPSDCKGWLLWIPERLWRSDHCWDNWVCSMKQLQSTRGIRIKKNTSELLTFEKTCPP